MHTDELFSPTNIVGVAVATAAVNAFSTTLYRAFKLPPKWTAFVAALALAYLVVFMKPAPLWYEWVLAFFNACLLFCSAAGVNEAGAAASETQVMGFAAPEPIFQSWFRKS